MAPTLVNRAAVAADVDSAPGSGVRAGGAKSRGRITPARRSIGRPWKSLRSRERILRYLTSSVVGRQRLVGDGSRQLQADGAAGRRVEPDGRHGAVQVSGRIGEVQVGVGVQEGLDRIGSGSKLAQAVDREDRRIGRRAPPPRRVRG